MRRQVVLKTIKPATDSTKVIYEGKYWLENILRLLSEKIQENKYPKVKREEWNELRKLKIKIS